MKSHNMLALGLAALAAAPMAAYSQDSGTKLQAYVVIGSKAARHDLVSAAGKNKYVYSDAGQQMQMDVSKCKMFFIPTPADFASAAAALRAGHLTDARKKLASVKKHYSEYVGLPGNPATSAALMELDCAARQLDWAGIKELASSFPHTSYLEGADKLKVTIAKVLGNISDDPASLNTQKLAIAEILKDPASKSLDIETYGRVRYALARAYEAQVKAEELAAGVTQEQAANLNKAIDNYCQAAMSTHGAHMEIPLDAMQRALRLLWAMPGVKDYAAQMKDVPMNASRWGSAPYDFKDAAALANLLKTVYTADAAASLPQKDLVLQIAKFYYNAEKDKAPSPEETKDQAPGAAKKKA